MIILGYYTLGIYFYQPSILNTYSQVATTIGLTP